MRKQITFEGNYNQDTRGIEWLLDLSRCFNIKKIKMRSYRKETKYTYKYCCQIEVTYDWKKSKSIWTRPNY